VDYRPFTELDMEHRIYEKIEGSIVPVPLIQLAVAISFPMVVLGAVLTAIWREMRRKDEKLL
jgi:hypothetical protein